MHLKTVNKNKKAQSVHSTGGKKDTKRKKEKQKKDLCDIKELQERF